MLEKRRLFVSKNIWPYSCFIKRELVFKKNSYNHYIQGYYANFENYFFEEEKEHLCWEI